MGYNFNDITDEMPNGVQSLQFYLIDIHGQAIAKYEFNIENTPKEIIKNLYFVAWKDLGEGNVEGYGSFYGVVKGTKDYRTWTNIEKFQAYVDLSTQCTKKTIEKLQKELTEGY